MLYSESSDQFLELFILLSEYILLFGELILLFGERNVLFVELSVLSGNIALIAERSVLFDKIFVLLYELCLSFEKLKAFLRRSDWKTAVNLEGFKEVTLEAHCRPDLSKLALFGSHCGSEV